MQLFKFRERIILSGLKKVMLNIFYFKIMNIDIGDSVDIGESEKTKTT